MHLSVILYRTNPSIVRCDKYLCVSLFYKSIKGTLYTVIKAFPDLEIVLVKVLGIARNSSSKSSRYS